MVKNTHKIPWNQYSPHWWRSWRGRGVMFKIGWGPNIIVRHGSAHQIIFLLFTTHWTKNIEKLSAINTTKLLYVLLNFYNSIFTQFYSLCTGTNFCRFAINIIWDNHLINWHLWNNIDCSGMNNVYIVFCSLLTSGQLMYFRFTICHNWHGR